MQNIKRSMTTLLTAGLAEVMAHFLSLGWGFLVLLGAFVYVAVHVTAGVTTATAKIVATEQRLNTHVTATAPAVNFVANGGTVGGTVVVNGDHHIVGTLWGNGGTLPVGDFVAANNGMTVNNGATVNGNFNAAGGITGAGGGTLENFSSIHTANNLQADGTVNSNQVIASSYLSVSGQRIAPGQNVPGAYPAVGSPSTAGLATYCNEIVVNLQAAGIFN